MLAPSLLALFLSTSPDSGLAIPEKWPITPSPFALAHKLSSA